MKIELFSSTFVRSLEIELDKVLNGLNIRIFQEKIVNEKNHGKELFKPDAL